MGFKHFFHAPISAGTGLKLVGIGYHEPMLPDMIYRPNGRRDYLFMWFHQNTDVGITQETQPIASNTLMIWEPGVPQCYGCMTGKWSHSWLHVSGKRVDTLLRSLRIPRNRPAMLHDVGEVERSLMAMHEEIVTQAKPDHRILANLMENWMRHVARATRPNANQSAVPEHFLAIKRRLETQYDQPVQLADLAEEANLSIAHFCAMFKLYFHRPAKEFVIDLRLNRAADLLGDHNLRVGEIAKRVGYEDVYHFSKLFKKRYGRSPRAYRQAM